MGCCLLLQMFDIIFWRAHITKRAAPLSKVSNITHDYGCNTLSRGPINSCWVQSSHNFQKDQVVPSRIVLRKWNQFCLSFPSAFTRCGPFCCKLAPETIFWLMKFSDSQSEATIAMILGAISSHKMDHTRWKGMLKCARKCSFSSAQFFLKLLGPFEKCAVQLKHC